MTPETARIIARMERQFMKPDVEGPQEYWEVSANHGETHIVPYDACASRAELPDYIEGRVDRHANGQIIATAKQGWLARLSAPGYMDCTDWTAHETEDAAYEYLAETYGDDIPEEEEEENMICRSCGFAGDGVQDFESTDLPGERFCQRCGSAECYMVTADDDDGE